MNKNFLKPNLLKVILTLLLLVLSYSFLSVPCKIGAVVPSPQFHWSTCRLIYSPWLSNILYDVFPNYEEPIGVFRIFLGIPYGSFIALFLVLILSYLVSCVIDSFIKKKK